MPHFGPESLLRWFHILTLALAGGAMPVCLLLSGFEDTREDVRGLSAAVWRKMAVWGMRLAVLFGVAVLAANIAGGGRPFSQPHLMFKIGMAPFLVLLCETAPKKLGAGRRGAAMGAMMLFLLTSFVASNGRAFFGPEAAPQTVAAPERTPTDEAKTQEI
jgi:hypothetical protein